jgi:hypothetical protein
MKQRLIVMNGCRIVRSQHAGQWETDREDKAGEIRLSIYNVYLSTPADKAKVNKGVVLYADKEFIYQLVGKICVHHESGNFSSRSEHGVHSIIRYENEKALITTPLTSLRRKSS